MLLSGIYAAEFFSNQNRTGTGVAIFSDNAFHGGDASHFYKGKYVFKESDQVEATLDVAQYAGVSGSSVVGLDRFRLTLIGHISENENTVSMSLEGVVKDHPSRRIKIQLRKLDDLVEA